VLVRSIACICRLVDKVLTDVGVRACCVSEHVYRGRPGFVTETRGLRPPSPENR